MEKFEDLYEQVNRHLDCTYQNWLFGAGISFESNIPLMYPMTEKIEKKLGETPAKTYENIKGFLPKNSHIEHYLSHIGDLLALLDRSQKDDITMNDIEYEKKSLNELYKEIIRIIGELVRFGYNADEDIEGDIIHPIVEIKPHRDFIRKLFNRRSNLENITNINFFTTNYDTLLEDALALEKKEVIDGFTGGAMGYWNPNELKTESKLGCYKVFKLHGSIDWHNDDEKGLIRCRYGTKYLSDNSNLLIYPQATKYVETQKDPFAFLFGEFRQSLGTLRDNVLITCGYSYGDSHINNEIDMALSLPSNKASVIIFIKETWNERLEKSFLPPVISDWLDKSNFKDRMFVLTDKGIYNRSSNLVSNPDSNNELDWWTFRGVTNLLE